MLACISREDFMNFTLRIVESSILMMRKQSLILQKPVSQHVFIFDMEGFSVKVSSAMMSPYITIIICYISGCQLQPHSRNTTKINISMSRYALLILLIIIHNIYILLNYFLITKLFLSLFQPTTPRHLRLLTS